jgi:hypothetical protein
MSWYEANEVRELSQVIRYASSLSYTKAKILKPHLGVD